MEKAHSLSLYRRSYTRFLIDAPATLVINKDLKKPSRVIDLSARGVCIWTDCLLNINEKVGIVIHAPIFFNNPIHKEAKIAWCKKAEGNSWRSGLDFGEDNKINFA